MNGIHRGRIDRQSDSCTHDVRRHTDEHGIQVLEQPHLLLDAVQCLYGAVELRIFLLGTLS
ncbi:hypothetical protein SDC9_197963 [bioreactor metagenome]|uniref:Uncharacterized protein n=1 Tax=bioreactor metagenome TaxID=1076179 RepID=A0A645IGB9_9ZZZZ